jgi:hypothetical protein
MVQRVRIPALFGFAALSCLAAADRLIDIPTAAKLPFGDFRLEYTDSVADGRTQLGYFDTGISTSFEAAIRTEQYLHHSFVTTTDFEYVYISPISDLTPGLAAGVQDVLGDTQDGRRYYVCATWRNTVESAGGDHPSDVTLGYYFGSHPAPFVGTSIPFSSCFRLLAEHDGIRLSAGFEFLPTPGVALRLVERGPDLMADLSFRGHF